MGRLPRPGPVRHRRLLHAHGGRGEGPRLARQPQGVVPGLLREAEARRLPEGRRGPARRPRRRRGPSTRRTRCAILTAPASSRASRTRSARSTSMQVVPAFGLFGPHVAWPRIPVPANPLGYTPAAARPEPERQLPDRDVGIATTPRSAPTRRGTARTSTSGSSATDQMYDGNHGQGTVYYERTLGRWRKLSFTVKAPADRRTACSPPRWSTSTASLEFDGIQRPPRQRPRPRLPGQLPGGAAVAMKYLLLATSSISAPSFPSSAWECTSGKLCFRQATGRPRPGTGSGASGRAFPAELGNEG